MHIKLIDFATCKLFNKNMASKAEKLTKMIKINPDKLPMHEQDERLFSLVGTEEYIAPETIVGSSTCYATDLWSLGVMVYQLLTGKVPFVTQVAIVEGNLPNFPSNFDETAKDLVTRLLQKDPADRIGSSDI